MADDPLPTAPWVTTAAPPAADLPSAPWVTLPGYRARQHAYRENIHAGLPIAPAGQEATGPDLSAERGHDLGKEWGDVGKGAAKGVPASIAGGALGDVEEFGRHAVNKLATKDVFSEKPEDQLVPPTTQGGYLGPRGLNIMNPAASKEEAAGMNIGSLLGPAGVLKATKIARGAPAASPVTRPGFPYTEKPVASEGSGLPRTPDGSPVAVAREGSGARLLPTDVPHVETLSPIEAILAGRRSAGAAGRSPLEEFSPETIAQMRKALEQEGVTPWTLDQRLEEMSPHQSLAEFSPNTEAHAGATASPPGAGKNEIINFFAQRGREAKERMRSTFDQVFGPAEDLAQQNRILNIDQATDADPLYRRFRSLEIPPTPSLDALVPRLRSVGAFAEAQAKAAAEGRPWQAEWFTPEQRTSPTAQSWDYVKRALDQKIGGSYDPVSGRATDWTRIYTNLKNDLLSAINRHPDPEIASVWREARRAWAGPEEVKNAQRLGRKLLTKAVDADEFRFETSGFGEHQIEGLRQGLRKELENSLGNPGKTELPVMKQILGENNQQKIRWVIGDEATDAVVRSIEHEFNMHGAPTRIHGNSQTSLRQQADKFWTPQPGLFSAKDLASALHGLTGAAAHAAKKTILARHTANQEAKYARMRDEAARIYTMQGPERDAVLRYLLSEPPRAKGGRVIKRADGGRTPKVDYQSADLGRTSKHEINTSYPITRNIDLTGSAHTYSNEPYREKPSDWGASIGLRKNFEDGGAPEIDPASEAEAARNSAAHRISRSVLRDDAVFEEPRPTPEVIKNIGSDYSEGVANQRTGAAAMGNEGVDNMRSGNPARMALGVGQGILSPVLGMTAPIGGAMNTLTKGFGRVGPGMEHAAEVATLLNPDTPLLKAAPMLAGVIPMAGKTTKAAAKAAVVDTADNLVNLGARREEKQVEGFHKDLMNEVGERAQKRMQVGAEYHESGKLPMPVGTRFTTNHSREQELLPWEVTGHYVDPKNPEKFGYYAQRGEPGQEGYERSTVLVNDPKRPEIAKLAEQFTPMGGPRAVQQSRNPVREPSDEGRQANEVAAAAQEVPGASARGPAGAGGLEGAQEAAARAAGTARSLEGLPAKPLKISTPEGDHVYVPGPIERIHQLADDYMREAGLKYQPITSYREVNLPRAKRIAEAYEKMPHAPNDPAVKASYDAMINETVAQLKTLQKSGLEIEFIKPGMKDPYEASPRLAQMDVRDNNHLWVFPTDAGFGSSGAASAAELANNPLLRKTGVTIGDHELLANDAFRIVHDFFGHLKDGVGFRAGGEENAWRSHSRMYSKLARPAMTSETRGQNSWLNYGPHGEKNRTAKSADTTYADQKTGIMPSWTHTEGLQDYYVAPKTDAGARIINAGVDAPTNKSAQTVADPHRMMYPGIYENPRKIAQEAAARVASEDIDMKRLWGVSRGDLDEMAKGRKGNRDPDVYQGPGVARGALSAQNIQTPQNTQRLQDILAEAGKHRGLKHADAWYILDPVYQRMEKLFGPQEAKGRFERFNTLMGMASPGSEVMTEIQRGTAANMKAEQGKFDEFLKYAGTPREFRKGPEDLRRVEAHPYHRTSQAEPMQKYLETGKIQSKEAKVPAYVQASGVPETGFQTRGPVADSHFSRGVGLADTRKGPTDVASSASRPEYHTLQPWWENEVAGEMGLESVPAQARLWTALGPRTGVSSDLGQGKLELLTKQIMKAAKRLGITPEHARDLILSGKEHAGMIAATAGVGAAGATNHGVGNAD